MAQLLDLTLQDHAANDYPELKEGGPLNPLRPYALYIQPYSYLEGKPLPTIGQVRSLENFTKYDYD